MRTCIVCGEKRSKRELIRLRLDGQQSRVVRDDAGCGEGRGAYVCFRRSCVEGLKQGRLLRRAFHAERPLFFSPDA